MFGIISKLFGSNRNNDPKSNNEPKVDKYGLPKVSFYDRACTAFWDVATLPTIILYKVPIFGLYWKFRDEEAYQFGELEKDYAALGRDKFIEKYKSTGYAYYLLPKFLKKKDKELGEAL